MSDRDKQLLEELRLFSDVIAQQISDKCVELDKKYKISSGSMEGHLVYLWLNVFRVIFSVDLFSCGN